MSHSWCRSLLIAILPAALLIAPATAMAAGASTSASEGSQIVSVRPGPATVLESIPLGTHRTVVHGTATTTTWAVSLTCTFSITVYVPVLEQKNGRLAADGLAQFYNGAGCSPSYGNTSLFRSGSVVVQRLGDNMPVGQTTNIELWHYCSGSSARSYETGAGWAPDTGSHRSGTHTLSCA